ncbi:radical SAM family heme chaperone HemW [candidate division KSB1 bacterium]|nr:radical SAM family heme chaperone HemW [candidate division KSB1 bacterium]
MHTFSLYIHVPFCFKKCNYCNFYSSTDLTRIDDYLLALQKEIEHYCLLFPPPEFILKSIYFGGGTPSVLQSLSIEYILSILKKKWNRLPEAQISFEINPGTVSSQKLSDLRRMGINRLSVGVQSFCDKDLLMLQRLHSKKDAETVIKQARLAGFSDVGIDLIFAIPGQTMKTWKSNLSRSLSLNPDHISVYGLTIEEETPLFQALRKNKVMPCDEELEREMYIYAAGTLKNAGYEHYEISNFALPGKESVHNQNYWQKNPYLGIGPAAHSFDGLRRCWNIADINRYTNRLHCDQSPLESCEQPSTNQQKIETIFLGLRQKSGIDLQRWKESYAQDLLQSLQPLSKNWNGLDDSTPPFSLSENNRCLSHNGNSLYLTLNGLLLYDTICSEIVSFLL